MNNKELLFCTLISAGYSPREAAYRAGYKHDYVKKADALLLRQDITDKIAEINRSKCCRTGEVESGLKRLAFGSIDDAVKLLFCDDVMPEHLDLYNVSEIKRGKNGVEIKFFDRQKALEKLYELSSSSGQNIEPIYKALNQSAMLLNEQ